MAAIASTPSDAALQPRTLPQIAASHPAARLYSLARRNLLPRHDALMAVRGRWAHQLLLDTGAAIDTLLWCPAEGAPPMESGEGVTSAGVKELAAAARTSYRISPRTLGRLHPDARAPEVLSVVRLPSWDPEGLLTADRRLLLIADGIEYAGNLGTLVRTVDACGAAGLVLTSTVARLTHPKVFAASRGTVLTTPVVEFPTVAAARDALVANGFPIFVADPAATQHYQDVALRGRRAAFVVGSEGDGVAHGWRHPAVTGVSIPMHGQADSLNVAVSAAILLFDAAARLGPPDLSEPEPALT